MSDTERPALTDVITQAIAYARSAGFETGDITPDDFALQCSPEGWQHATHVGDGHVITATIDPDGRASTDAGWIDWVSEDIDIAEADEDEGLLRVYLPGDPPVEGPAATAEQLEAALPRAVSADA